MKLMTAAEKAKKDLSPYGVNQCPINIECLMEDRDFHCNLVCALPPHLCVCVCPAFVPSAACSFVCAPFVCPVLCLFARGGVIHPFSSSPSADPGPAERAV